jgi:hypothetical protein
VSIVLDPFRAGLDRLAHSRALSPSPATFRATNLDGFEYGTTSSGQFVPFVNQSYQQDGGTGAPMVRTLSGGDFVNQLFMRLSFCNSGCANPGGAGWSVSKAILLPPS